MIDRFRGRMGALALAARRSYLDRIIAALFDEESARIAPRFSDWQALWRQDEAAIHVLGYNDFIDAPLDDDAFVRARYSSMIRVPMFRPSWSSFAFTASTSSS